MENRFDLIVIGSGPGGYVAAIRAAQLGMKTALAENCEIGGTCLNRGCIPTKTLMHGAHIYYEASRQSEIGIEYSGLSFNYDKMKEQKVAVVDKIRHGIQGLLEANGVTLLYGTAQIQSNSNSKLHRITLNTLEGSKSYESEKILIATGSKPVVPAIDGVGLRNVVTSDDLLSENGKLYQRLLIIGGGVIGVEFATLYRELDCEVEIIEAADRILPNLDKEISQSVAMSLKKKGITIHTKAKVIKLQEKEGNGLTCEYIEKENIRTSEADGILLSVGRRANTEGLFGEGLQLEMDRSCIKVNQEFETSIAGIYGIGDVIPGMQLAHAASAQGIVAVERMCGKEASVDLKTIPSCIYTSPEVAVVGMDEAEAKDKGYKVSIGKYPMLGNSKTLLSMGERGFVKVICDSDTDRILGAQLLCDRATDIIGEFATAITAGLRYQELASVIRPHPTYSEAITEALEDVEGMAIHLMPRKR